MSQVQELRIKWNILTLGRSWSEEDRMAMVHVQTSIRVETCHPGDSMTSDYKLERHLLAQGDFGEWIEALSGTLGMTDPC